MTASKACAKFYALPLKLNRLGWNKSDVFENPLTRSSAATFELPAANPKPCPVNSPIIRRPSESWRQYLQLKLASTTSLNIDF